jgi:hypothetical protein
MPAPTIQQRCRRDEPESARERRTVGRAGHILASLGIIQAGCGWLETLSHSNNLGALEQASLKERLSISHARPTFNNECQQASDSGVSMCNVETRQSATPMSRPQGGQWEDGTSHTRNMGAPRRCSSPLVLAARHPTQRPVARQTCGLYHRAWCWMWTP